MTAKRFALTKPKNNFQEMKYGINDKTFNKTLTINEIVDTLNKFQELSINDLKQIEQLKEENEQLKKDAKYWAKIAEARLKEIEQFKETNQELYDFRLILNALLFNEWAKTGEYEVYKSKRHHDGSIPFPDDNEDWFIVVAILPSGQVTNHYHIKYWDYFKIPSYPKVKDEFDGHTSSVVLLRYGVLLE